MSLAYKWTVLSNTSLGSLIASIDMTIVLISLPDIFRGLHINAGDPSNFPYLLWTMVGYSLVTAVVLVTIGRLSDIYGRVKLYKLGFLIFTIGSITCALSQNILQLIIFRLFQGLGGAFLFANSAAIITDSFEPNERGKALGINQIAFLTGQFVGLVLGGVIAPFGWSYIFWVTVPFGIIGTIWAQINLKELGVINKNQKIDLLGNITFGGGLTLILLGISYILVPYGDSELGWGDPFVQLALTLGSILLFLFVYIEKRTTNPMFRLDLFKIKDFSFGTSSLFLSFMARGGLLFMLVIWLQGIWLPLHGITIEQTPFWAGIYMLPMTAGFLIMGPLSGYLSDKYGQRPFMVWGMILAAASFIWLAFMPYNVDYLSLALAIFLQGIGTGMFASPNMSLIMSSVPAETRGAASGMRATIQNVAQSLSMTIYFAILIIALESHFLDTALAKVPASSALFSVFLGLAPPGVNADTFVNIFAPIFMESFSLLLIISTVLSIIAALFSYKTNNNKKKNPHTP
ncbi:Putative multidrug resistance protein MdtD [uncultured archaeon]|nr:Putative multidrug resistance protein MdtD [uncultured archaeon]